MKVEVRVSSVTPGEIKQYFGGNKSEARRWLKFHRTEFYGLLSTEGAFVTIDHLHGEKFDMKSAIAEITAGD